MLIGKFVLSRQCIWRRQCSQINRNPTKLQWWTKRFENLRAHRSPHRTVENRHRKCGYVILCNRYEVGTKTGVSETIRTPQVFNLDDVASLTVIHAVHRPNWTDEHKYKWLNQTYFYLNPLMYYSILSEGSIGFIMMFILFFLWTIFLWNKSGPKVSSSHLTDRNCM